MAIPIIFNQPITIWLGITVFISLVSTATLGFLFHKRIGHIRFVWHRRMAIVTLILAVAHASFAVYANLL